MATSEWNSIDNFEPNFELYDCAFLDILGYKNQADAFFDGRFNLFARIERAFRRAADVQHLTRLLLDANRISIETFSDSIIMLQPSGRRGLGAMIPFTCHFASLLSLEGLFVRGGVSRGKHFRSETSCGLQFLASEALQKAYILESTEAIVPRVLVDPELIESLSNEEKHLIVGEDGKFFIDFAHHLINRDAKNFHDVQAEMTELYGRLMAEPSDRVKEKIQWLLDYYHWTIDTNPKWADSEFISYRSSIKRDFHRLPP